MTSPVRLGDVLPRVLLGCTSCERTWEPDWSEIPVTTGCPWCGGWTFICRLDEPSSLPAQGVTPGMVS